MTENEAIDKLNNLHYKIVHTSFCNKVYESEIEALCMAKDCLKEKQQCRAIGTVEGYENAIKAYTETYILMKEYKSKVQDFEAIGTIEEFKALKERSVAKKPLHNGANWYRCPNGCEVHKKAFEKDWYCPKCGQKLDWQ